MIIQHNIPDDTTARKHWIIYQLRLRGLTLASIGREHGVCRNAPRIAFDRPYPRMERALAAAIDLKPEQLFPERYDAKGRPNRKVGRPAQADSHVNKDNKVDSSRNVKLEQAAGVENAGNRS